LRQTVPLAWDGTPLSPARRQPGFALFPLPWPAGDRHAPCRLGFPEAEPLRLQQHGRLIAAPTLRDVTLAALRRVQALAAPEYAERLQADHDHWLAAADQVPFQHGTWSPADLVQYSGSQHRDVERRGVAGELLLPEGAGELVDLLAAACWLHLGKGTVMGMGKVRIEQMT
jgi:hypothetical protein